MSALSRATVGVSMTIAGSAASVNAVLFETLGGSVNTTSLLFITAPIGFGLVVLTATGFFDGSGYGGASGEESTDNHLSETTQ